MPSSLRAERIGSEGSEPREVARPRLTPRVRLRAADAGSALQNMRGLMRCSRAGPCEQLVAECPFWHCLLSMHCDRVDGKAKQSSCATVRHEETTKWRDSLPMLYTSRANTLLAATRTPRLSLVQLQPSPQVTPLLVGSNTFCE